ALAAGCDGVVSSGLEVERLRQEAPRELIVVTPGIRPVDNDVVSEGGGDQKRVMTPSRALGAGADYLVVGRPIRDAADPRAAALTIQTEIALACA
ncbi:MAG: orotidine 5'-phosphate decarboxylase, partial [Nevskia sp.]|nr:orotidine 5'-phosphate decarboxylase [Nevskia sp.]